LDPIKEREGRVVADPEAEDQPLDVARPRDQRRPERGVERYVTEPPHVRERRPRRVPDVRDAERQQRTEAVGLAQHHQLADPPAPVVADEQQLLEPHLIEQREHVGRDVLLRPPVAVVVLGPAVER
jgi:hypothetical protein